MNIGHSVKLFFHAFLKYDNPKGIVLELDTHTNGTARFLLLYEQTLHEGMLVLILRYNHTIRNFDKPFHE